MVSGQPFSKDYRAAVKQLYTTTKSVRQTARLFGISRRAVENAINPPVRRYGGSKNRYGLEVNRVMQEILDEEPDLYIHEVRDRIFEYTYLNPSYATGTFHYSILYLNSNSLRF